MRRYWDEFVNKHDLAAAEKGVWPLPYGRGSEALFAPRASNRSRHGAGPTVFPTAAAEHADVLQQDLRYGWAAVGG